MYLLNPVFFQRGSKGLSCTSLTLAIFNLSGKISDLKDKLSIWAKFYTVLDDVIPAKPAASLPCTHITYELNTHTAFTLSPQKCLKNLCIIV